MNVPDKIYIEQKAIMYDMVNTESCKPDDYEYIRKGSLLEWAKEELTKASKSSGTIGRRNAFIDIIEKIESL